MTSILLTGGAGFIGSHLAERLLDIGIRLTIVDDLNDFYSPTIKKLHLRQIGKHGSFRFVQMDIRNLKGMEEALSGEFYDVIIHLAARPGVRTSMAQQMLYEGVNVQGTISLLEFARRFQCHKFIFASSSSIYGTSNRIPFSENDLQPKPISPYGITKLAAEKFCYSFAHLHQIETVCLRFFTVFGPRQRPDSAIHKFARHIQTDKKISVFGDGSSQRDYTYVDDIVEGILSALNLNVLFDTFNLGNSAPISLMKMIHLLERQLGKKAHLCFQGNQPGDLPITHADLSKSRKILGYSPKVPFKKGLEYFVDWLQSVEFSEYKTSFYLG